MFKYIWIFITAIMYIVGWIIVIDDVKKGEESSFTAVWEITHTVAIFIGILILFTKSFLAFADFYNI